MLFVSEKYKDILLIISLLKSNIIYVNCKKDVYDGGIICNCSFPSLPTFPSSPKSTSTYSKTNMFVCVAYGLLRIIFPVRSISNNYDKNINYSSLVFLFNSYFIKGEVSPRGVLQKKLGRGVRPASQNLYPIYDQNLRFSLPYL